MHIFIDESGSFCGIGQFPSPSLVGALIIPDAKLSDIERRYARIRSTLRTDNGEVKGRLLRECEVARVVEMLRKNEVLFEVTMIDLGTHTEAGLQNHKEGQIEGITENLTNQHHSNTHNTARRLRNELEKMSLQLYVQSVLTFELINNLIRRGTLYYCQRRPRELGDFHWVIDAKDNSLTPTPWEKWWSLVVMPSLQTKFLRNPAILFRGGDYTYFRRFESPLAEYLVQHLPDVGKERPTVIDLKLLLTESFRVSSSAEPGLELVDIVTNAVRRALVGNRAKTGWGEIPRLMIHRRQHYISVLALEGAANPPQQYPYMPVLQSFAANGRNMMVP